MYIFAKMYAKIILQQAKCLAVCIHNASQIVVYKIPDSWAGVAPSQAQTKKERCNMIWIIFCKIIVVSTNYL